MAREIPSVLKWLASPAVLAIAVLGLTTATAEAVPAPETFESSQ